MKMSYQSSNNSEYSFFLRFLLSVIGTFFCCGATYAQLKLVPIDNGVSSESSARLQAAGDTLSLPFLDDFSSAKTVYADSSFWMPGSGVYINNTLTINHPSLNIATFDGVNGTGVPYNLSNPLSRNFTDTLTSRPISLLGKAEKDSIYLSFYWAGKGLGEKPDSADYLSLEFFGKNGEWIEMWKQDGYSIDSLFHQTFVKVSDANYLHGAFQFRFRGYGRNSGPYDTWHLDYVYLNEKRSATDRFIKDITTRKAFSSLLKNYSAMPLRQYLVNPAAATSSSITTDIVNLNSGDNFNTFTYTISDTLTPGKTYFTLSEVSTRIAGYSGTGAFQNQVRTYSPGAINIESASSGVTLKQKLVVGTTDKDNPIPNLNLNRNDTIYAYTDLKDYYAYDDASAEYGVQVSQKLAKVAIRYALSKPDTIAGIRLSVVPFNKDISGQSFTVEIYANDGGRPSDKPLAQRSVSARYPAERNGFFEYAFGSPVAVKDTFFIGWTQLTEDPVSFGFDRNSFLGKDQIYYNLGTGWVKEVKLGGSVMFRPYVGTSGQGVVTGVEPVTGTEDYFFPNPNRGELNWKNSMFKRIDIFSVHGALMQSIVPAQGQRSALLHVAGDGIYIINAWNGKQSVSQKVLIIK